MITLKLNDATHDIDLTNGSPSLIDGREHDRQDIDTALQLFKGEWFLDPAKGVPYFDRILIKAMNEGDVLSLLRAYLLRRSSVQVVQELEVDSDPTTTRGIAIRGEVVDSTGDLLQIFTTAGA